MKKYLKELKMMQNKHQNSKNFLEKNSNLNNNSLIDLDDTHKIRQIKKQIAMEVVEKEKEMGNFKRLVEKDIKKGLSSLKDKVNTQLNIDRIRDLKGLPKTKESVLIRSRVEKIEEGKKLFLKLIL